LFSKLKKVLDWQSSTKPEFSLDKEIYGQFKPFRLPLFLMQFVMLIGTLGYVFIDNFSLLDALYQTGITFTTVGFGEIAPISPRGRIFTITLIILGFAVFSFAVAILADVVNNGVLFKLLKERQMLYKVARLKGHYVVCYHNEYTIQLTKELRKNHIPFVVIDPDENIENIAKEYQYPYYLQEDPHTEKALLKSHLSSAKGVISVSKNLADNIAQVVSIRLFEKELKRKPYYIISYAQTQSDIDKLKKLGADNVVSPTKLMAKKVSAMAVRPDMQNILEEFLNNKDSSLDLEEIEISDESWAIYKKIRDTNLRDALNVSIVGIKTEFGGIKSMPKGDTIITRKAKLLIIGKPKDIKDTRIMLGKKERPKELDFV
jgi:voltage-gated potassium channel